MKKLNPQNEYLNLCKNLNLILEFKSKRIELTVNNLIKSNINKILNDLYRYRKLINLDSKSDINLELDEKEKEKLENINQSLFKSIFDMKKILKKKKIKINYFDNLIKFYTYIIDFLELNENTNTNTNTNKMIDSNENNEDNEYMIDINDENENENNLKIDILTNLFSTL